mmetsp:Transcript_7921/g.12131  ORF Transcript_7921/g.12131 Transcript_7921/m.12131 type:complete len:541 (-) Transcript_7921:109-1731(-)
MPSLDNDLAFLHSLEPSDVGREHHERLLKILQQPDNQIPSLQHNHTAPNNLLQNSKEKMIFRYRGMVQDMMNPEYYHSSNTSQFCERQPLVLIPIPFSNKNPFCSLSSKKKREREEEDDDSTSVSSVRNKRTQQLQQHSPSAPRDWKDPSVDDDVEMADDKKNWWQAGCMGSHPNEIPILAQFYDANNTTNTAITDNDHDDGGTKIKLNDVVELIGVLDASVVKKDEEVEEVERNLEMNEFLFDDELPRHLPCVHVLCHKILSLRVLCDESDIATLSEEGEGNNSEFSALVEALRLTLFSQAERKKCGAPIRTPMETTLGCASLNVVLPTEESCWSLAQKWQAYLEQIVPVVGVLSTKQITDPPKKEKGKMVLCPLQLPRGAALILVDNGGGQPFLASLTQHHSLSYEFEGGISYLFEADYRLIVLSVQKASSVLPCSLSMVCNNPTETLGKPEARKLYEELQQSPEGITLGPDVLQQAQHDFLNRRQEARRLGSKIVEEEDFHRWLTLTRLQARSEGHDHATVEDWEKALRVDDLMTGR